MVHMDYLLTLLLLACCVVWLSVECGGGVHVHLLPGGGLSPGHHPVCTQHLQGVLHSSLCGIS